MISIEFHSEIDSTQRRARELVERDDRRWEAVCADHQTAGRGRQGAAWHDTPNQSLLVSLILWDAPRLQPAGMVGLLAALATTHALEQHYPELPPIQLKYPNDLMLHGRKLGGVLTEVVDHTPIVGIGINLTQVEFPPALQAIAISVRQGIEAQATPPHAVVQAGQTDANLPVGGRHREGVQAEVSRAERAALIAALSTELRRLIVLWQAHPETVHTLWVARDGSAGRAYRILDLPDQPTGIALGVMPDFRLRLRLPDGMEYQTYYVSAV